MAKRPDTLDTALLVELLRRIPRGRKITTRELHQQLQSAGFERDLRTIQRQGRSPERAFRHRARRPQQTLRLPLARARQGLAVPQLTLPGNRCCCNWPKNTSNTCCQRG